MAHAKAFQGFVPARKKGGAYNTGSFTEIFSPTSGGACNNNIFSGDPVVLPGANFATISPFIAATLKPSGIFAGCSYVLNGEQKFSRYWGTGTSAAGYSDVKFFIITDPDQTYYIQCSLSLSANELMITKNYNVTVSSTASSGNTTTGQSSYYLLAASGGETEQAARVIGKKRDGEETDDTDAFPIVEVFLNTHRDRYVTATASTA